MIPVLPRGVRLKQDMVRGQPVLLGPERALMLDAVGAAILARVDGRTPVERIVTDLAAAYEAPAEVIRGDVESFLGDLCDRRLIDWLAPA